MKRSRGGLALLASLCVLIGSDAVAAGEARLYPVEVDGKHGAIDRAGKLVIEPQYDQALHFAGGMARVSLNGKVGYVDAAGTLLISPKATISIGTGDFAAERSLAALIESDFSEGLAAYRLDGRYGYVDTEGKIVIAPQFEQVDLFRDGLAIVRVNGRYGWIDKTGKLVIPAEYDKALPFSEGLGTVLLHGQGFGYLDRSGKLKIKPQFNYAYPFAGGRARAQVSGGYGYIDTSGKLVVPPPENYRLSSDFSDGLAVVNVTGKGWGYIDPSGRLAIASQFFSATPFKEGLARVTPTGGSTPDGRWTEKKWGYIDRKGKSVIAPQFDDARDFSEGFAAVAVKGRGYGFVDKNGKLKIEPKYAAVEDFSGGLARVWLERENRGAHAYLNADGKVIWKTP